MKQGAILLLFLIFFVPDISKATEPYDYISDVIRSFERLKIADERFKNSDNNTHVLFMKNIILFNKGINAAAQFIKPHVSSKNNLINKSARNKHRRKLTSL